MFREAFFTLWPRKKEIICQLQKVRFFLYFHGFWGDCSYIYTVHILMEREQGHLLGPLQQHVRKNKDLISNNLVLATHVAVKENKMRRWLTTAITFCNSYHTPFPNYLSFSPLSCLLCFLFLLLFSWLLTVVGHWCLTFLEESNGNYG